MVEKVNPMSHVVTVQTKVRDTEALAAACRRLELAAPVQESVSLFNASVSGLVVRLPGWQFPVVVDLSAGSVVSSVTLAPWRAATSSKV